jgi:D-alanyl-D-alanine carboxypeptidase (penicillin-binding protein 5/6)
LSPRARSVYLDRPSSRRRSSYGGYSSGHHGGGLLRRLAFALLALVVVAVALVVVQMTRSVPAQQVRPAFAASVTAPGQTPRLPWPSEGQAAVAVADLGAVGSAGGSAPVPIASLAKMMTAYQVLTDHPLALRSNGPSMTVGAADVADYRKRAHNAESVLAVQAGERLGEYQALQALLIPSANNIASLLARWDAGSEAAFLTKINATAKRLGLTATHYADPAGQDAATVSTATDQLMLAQQAMKLPVFASIVAQPAATFPVAGRLFNYNYFIGHDGFVGIKTGSNAAAGGCWAFAARRTVAGKPTTVFGVVLGQHAKNGELIQPALDIGRRLADAVPTAVQQMTVVAAGTTVGSLRAPWRDDVPLVTQKAISLTGVPGQRLTPSLRLQSPSKRDLPAGTVVGQLTVSGVTTAVVVAKAAPGPTIGWRLTRT